LKRNWKNNEKWEKKKIFIKIMNVYENNK
jgi:hypothetical protein